MRFPITELLDETECLEWLEKQLHPSGLSCPRCGCRNLSVHSHRAAPKLDWRCAECRRIFNVFTGTIFQGTHRSARQIVLILRGFLQGVPTLHLARELNTDRKHLLELRHRIQHAAWFIRLQEPLEDKVVEVDEMFQNAGEKGIFTPSRTIRLGAAPTSAGDMGPGRRIDHPFKASSGGKAARSA